jgi:GntR family transcriptional regulator, transcriptional repressor for pyruvate dehydrogenase complex
MTEVVRQSLSDALTERVLGLIRDDGLQAGDRLPSARALAERFAVATPTLREVLRRLQATGAVEIRHGSGVYVGETMSRLLLPNPIWPSWPPGAATPPGWPLWTASSAPPSGTCPASPATTRHCTTRT